MQGPPLRIAQRADALEENADDVHGGKGGSPARHRPQHAISGAGIAIFGIERVGALGPRRPQPTAEPKPQC